MAYSTRSALEYATESGPDYTAGRRHVWTLRLTARDVHRMSPRQVHDVRAGLRLLRAGLTPDAFFDGHSARNVDSAGSMMDRIEIMGALDEIEAMTRS